MQERTLGSIIMGGIALLGVVWAVIEGVPPLANAKKAEKALEEKISQIVNEKEITYISVSFNKEDEEAHNVDEEIYTYLESYKNNDYRLVVLNDLTIDKAFRKAFLSKNSIEIYKN